jgi:hypothetical protein
MLRCAQLISLFLVMLVSACGGVSGDNGSDPFGGGTGSNSSTLKLGYFDSQGQFVAGQIKLVSDANGIAQISAGGSIGLSVVVVDSSNSRVQTSTMVTFTSNCATADKASLVSSASTINGEVNTTFTDLGCGGNSGNRDQITATISTDNGDVSANAQLDILAEAIGGLSFVSLSADKVLLNGTGDSQQSQSVVTFLVSNEQGIGLRDQAVSFTLSTEIGGLTLSNTTAVSNSAGEVSTTVIAGNVPTSLRVNASVTGASGDTLQTQSDSISVTTGLPSQRGFSLSVDVSNIEGKDFSGQQAVVIARLSDSFGNPVPDNTLVYFTTEAGQIEASCATVNGDCEVILESGEPNVSDGKLTVLATAIGHEALFDSNGNNVFDDADGGALTSLNNSGFGNTASTVTGFVDMSEAWRDDNENGEWDATEVFLDYNNNQQFDGPDGLFNGPQCTASTLCGEGTANKIHVRKATSIIFSGSTARISVSDENGLIAATESSPKQTRIPELNRGDTAELTLLVGDVNNNIMPANTQISVVADAGALTTEGLTVVPSLFQTSPSELTLRLNNNLAEGEEPALARISIVVNTPNQVNTTLIFTVSLL